MRHIKWPEISTVKIPTTDGQIDNSELATMAEIADNLHRREIAALEPSKLRAK